MSFNYFGHYVHVSRLHMFFFFLHPFLSVAYDTVGEERVQLYLPLDLASAYYVFTKLLQPIVNISESRGRNYLCMWMTGMVAGVIAASAWCGIEIFKLRKYSFLAKAHRWRLTVISLYVNHSGRSREKTMRGGGVRVPRGHERTKR